MVCAHISYSEEVHILGPFCVWGGLEPIETLFPLTSKLCSIFRQSHTYFQRDTMSTKFQNWDGLFPGVLFT